MRKKKTQRTLIVAALTVTVMLLSACVDDSYDLTNDIDLKMTIGGDSLIVPSSSTEEVTMDKILDMDLDNTGTLRIAEADNLWDMAEGDLYLWADNYDDNSRSTLTMPNRVTMSGFTQTASNSVTFSSGKAQLNDVNAGTLAITSNNVDHRLIEVDEAKVQSTVTITLSGDGITLEEGFTVELPSYWTLSGNDTKYSANDDNKVVINAQTTLPTTLKVEATDINFTKGAGISFTAGDPGRIELAGNITLSGTATSTNASGTLTTTTTIGDVVIESVYGVTDPDIDINVEPMTFNDVADVLQEEETSLDWHNPQVYITVENPTNITFNIDQIHFTSHLEHNGFTDSEDLLIGSNYVPETTSAPIIVGSDPNGYKLGLYADHLPNAQVSLVDDPIRITGMVNLMKRIPDSMDVYEIEAKATDDRCWVELGKEEELGVTYELLTPLSFGSDLTIAYKDTLDGWKHDLRKVKRANELLVKFDVTNKVPLELSLAATAIDENGQEIDTNVINCAVEPEETTINAGDTDAPMVTPVTVRLTIADDNISNLDGLIVNMKSTDKNGNGAIINQKQSIKLDNVQLMLIGGVTFEF